MPKKNFKHLSQTSEMKKKGGGGGKERKNLKGQRQFCAEPLPNHPTEAGNFILILTSKDSQPEDLDEVPQGSGIWKDNVSESPAFKELQACFCSSRVSAPSPHVEAMGCCQPRPGSGPSSVLSAASGGRAAGSSHPLLLAGHY